MQATEPHRVDFAPTFLIADCCYPGRIDWRRVNMSITIGDRSAYLIVKLRRKTDGRRTQDLAACKAFEGVLEHVFETILETALPHYKGPDRRHPLHNAPSRGYGDNGSRTPSASYQLSDWLALQLRDLSSHEWMTLHSTAAQVARDLEAKRRAKAR